MSAPKLRLVDRKEKQLGVQGSKQLTIRFTVLYSIVLLLINLCWVGTYPGSSLMTLKIFLARCIPYSWCIHIHTTSLTFIFLFSIWSHSYYDFYFEATLLIVETTVIVIKLSQAVMFIPIQPFRILHVNAMMYEYTIYHYCNCRRILLYLHCRS